MEENFPVAKVFRTMEEKGDSERIFFFFCGEAENVVQQPGLKKGQVSHFSLYPFFLGGDRKDEKGKGEGFRLSSFRWSF